jgi:ribosomal protein S16
MNRVEKEIRNILSLAPEIEITFAHTMKALHIVLTRKYYCDGDRALLRRICQSKYYNPNFEFKGNTLLEWFISKGIYEMILKYAMNTLPYEGYESYEQYLEDINARLRDDESFVRSDRVHRYIEVLGSYIPILAGNYGDVRNRDLIIRIKKVYEDGCVKNSVVEDTVHKLLERRLIRKLKF